MKPAFAPGVSLFPMRLDLWFKPATAPTYLKESGLNLSLKLGCLLFQGDDWLLNWHRSLSIIAFVDLLDSSCYNVEYPGYHRACAEDVSIRDLVYKRCLCGDH
jgi:hypothetical protein